MADTYFEKYANRCAENLFYPGANEGKMNELVYLCLGIAGEAGEAVDVVKKEVRKGANELDEKSEQKFIEELGDLMWYQAQLLRVLGVDLETLISGNERKLNARHELKPATALRGTTSDKEPAAFIVMRGDKFLPETMSASCTEALGHLRTSSDKSLLKVVKVKVDLLFTWDPETACLESHLGDKKLC